MSQGARLEVVQTQLGDELAGRRVEQRAYEGDTEGTLQLISVGRLLVPVVETLETEYGFPELVRRLMDHTLGQFDLVERLVDEVGTEDLLQG